ncbi:MAG TPA: KUP/HAK/KT family potassium transporter [Solirubrobacteraceae bacterium]|jgi:KUP system potassium uptake protein|nr:KUP/HAK/KT family potassium transporter [Solirubrobacteraceae bacterium]
MSAPHRRRSLHEAAHKLDQDTGNRLGLAQRLNYRPVSLAPLPVDEAAAGPRPDDDERDVVAHASRIVLALGALGVVYGDLGTSPLYAEQVIFTKHAEAAHTTIPGVYGIVSLIFWALTIIVSLKYAWFLMRAHNRGDGGVMALAALIQRRGVGRTTLLVTLGIFGAGLFFGDGMITPAISVTSAVEGLKVATPGLAHLVIPISLGILAGLFAIQRRGTGAVGWLFGPVILVWFAVIGVLGAREVIQHPGVLQALAPTWGLRFVVDHGLAAFLTLGGVVLAVTGAEALYADRGHFGATPIRRTWFGIVFPAVLLSYLGQGALILAHPHTITNPFYLLVPSGGRIAMVVLATAATIIASQAAITGSFSMARQAVQLGFLPRLKILHTSQVEGQIYVPVISWALALGVVALVLVFQSSTRLANIYGVAVTGTFILDSVLFLAVAHYLWRSAAWKLVLVAALFLTVEVSFFSSNLTKVGEGAWIPLCVGLLASLVMVTWRRGREIVTRNRIEEEGPLSDFLYQLRMADPPIQRVMNVAIYLSPGKLTTPLAMRADVQHHRVFHDKVLIVSVEPVSVPHIEAPDRFAIEILGSGLFKILRVTIRTGYHDRTDVPAALALARKRGLLEKSLDLEHASYFVSRMSMTPTGGRGMRRWRKLLFITMARNATSPIDHFGLPVDKTVIVSSHVAI